MYKTQDRPTQRFGEYLFGRPVIQCFSEMPVLSFVILEICKIVLFPVRWKCPFGQLRFSERLQQLANSGNGPKTSNKFANSRQERRGQLKIRRALECLKMSWDVVSVVSVYLFSIKPGAKE